MLNETLKKVQSTEVGIRDCGVQVLNTGIGNAASANLGVTELAKQRFQRMRRRHERGLVSRDISRGWVARMA